MTEKLNPITKSIIANPTEGKEYYMVVIANGFDQEYTVVKQAYYKNKHLNLIFRAKLYLDKRKAQNKANKLNFRHYLALYLARILDLLVNRINQVIR